MSNLTELLRAANQGDNLALGELFERVYVDLRQLAAQRLAHERAGQTLQPTALVHEVYFRLIGVRSDGSSSLGTKWEGSRHFFAAAAEAMRRILIEVARRKSRQKHGGQTQRVDLDPEELQIQQLQQQQERADELMALDEALTRFESVEPKVAELVRLRFFAGLTNKEAAEQLGISPRTADVHWAYARAWFKAEMSGGGP